VIVGMMQVEAELKKQEEKVPMMQPFPPAEFLDLRLVLPVSRLRTL
jgi:hypothetical protein